MPEHLKDQDMCLNVLESLVDKLMAELALKKKQKDTETKKIKETHKTSEQKGDDCKQNEFAADIDIDKIEIFDKYQTSKGRQSYGFRFTLSPPSRMSNGADFLHACNRLLEYISVSTEESLGFKRK